MNAPQGLIKSILVGSLFFLAACKYEYSIRTDAPITSSIDDIPQMLQGKRALCYKAIVGKAEKVYCMAQTGQRAIAFGGTKARDDIFSINLHKISSTATFDNYILQKKSKTGNSYTYSALAREKRTGKLYVDAPFGDATEAQFRQVVGVGTLGGYLVLDDGDTAAKRKEILAFFEKNLLVTNRADALVFTPIAEQDAERFWSTSKSSFFGGSAGFREEKSRPSLEMIKIFRAGPTGT